MLHRLSHYNPLPARAIAIALLIAQPLLFFRHVLFSPRKHIPYDIEGFHLPLAAFIARSVREHVLPLWAPYAYCGMPIHADIQAQLFYPPTWISLLLGNASSGHKLFYWLEWQIPLHMILAGLFTFWLLRYLGLSIATAYFGATVYQLGGFFASQAQHLGAVSCAAWLPLLLLAIWKLSRAVTPRWIAAFAVGVALSVLAGFTAATVVVLISAAMVTIARLWATKTKSKFAVSVVAGLALGLGLSAVQIIPTYQLTGLSIASQRPQAEGGGGGLRFESLASLVWPNYYHIFTPFDGSFKLHQNFTFLYLYCGILALLLALIAPFLRRAAHARLFFALTLIAGVWMLGDETPIYRAVFTHLPRVLRGGLYAEEAMIAFCLFMALTAAVVLERIGGNWPAWALWAIALLSAGDLMHFGADRPMNSYDGSYKVQSNEYTLFNDAALLARLQRLAGETTPPSRIDYTARDRFPSILGADLLKLPTTDGDNPFALKRVIAIRRLFTKGNWWERELPVDRPESPILKMLNVGFLAAPSDQPQQPTGMPLAFESIWMRVYRNPGVLPRFFLVRHLHFASSSADALSYLEQPSFEPAEEAVVETKNLSTNQPLSAGSVRVDRYSPNRIELDVTTSGPAFLASSEVLYPGWTATVNGKKAPLYMTNGAFRGMMLATGASQIVMDYRPSSLIIGAIISALSAVIVVLALLRARTS